MFPLDSQRDHLRKAVPGWIYRGFSGISDRVLHRDLHSSGQGRRGKVDRVRAPQVEARRRIVAEADLARYVVRRDEIAARDSEKTQHVTVFLERRIHVAQPHRAPVGGHAGKRITVADVATPLVDGDLLLELADRFHPSAEVLTSSEAEIGVADLHFRPVGDSVGSGGRN